MELSATALEMLMDYRKAREEWQTELDRNKMDVEATRLAREKCTDAASLLAIAASIDYKNTQGEG